MVVAEVVLAIVPGVFSTDLFSYIWYGRIFGVFGDNPFTHVPADYAWHDTGNWLQWVFWKETPSAYGPVWVLLAGIVAQIAQAFGGDITFHILGNKLLADRPGAAPGWDNVVYGTRGLGYVDARHQTLDPTPRATVLTWYRPLGPSTWDGTDGRRQLLARPWAGWRDDLLAELSAPHPDLAGLATRIDITRYGHAMAIPAPGQLAKLGAQDRIVAGRLAFAHGDWSGYSIFEEAFTRGHLAAAAV